MEVFVCAFFKNERSFCFFKTSGHSAMHFLKAFETSGFIKAPPKKRL
ncbi:hypothetical protein [Helicobacter pylori]|uniref:Uncharacterized protein n=1 Tax=Helicobacter pylori SouthAfrica50 TaxID=1352357 RepID=T2SB59_HELPX|nr:hypothetical protein [Helicobacter pylori]EQD89603.1 hypothetical protein HPSA50_1932 [Helicobacter pylori SouthAfrica50]